VLLPIVTCMGICGKVTVDAIDEDLERERAARDRAAAPRPEPVKAAQPRPEATKPSSTARRAARPTSCGVAAAAPSWIADEVWQGYRCRSERAAGERWEECLARADYAADGGVGCPGQQRCCPGE
jgi:hypothetical protein